jgi:colicin import membrane protein
VDQSGSAPDQVARLDALEAQLRHLTSRLADWVEVQLAQSVEDRRAELRALRAELLEAVDGRAVAPPGGGDADEVATRIEAFEQRVKAAMGRLTDSVEARLAETTAGRSSELDALRSSLADRLDTLERAEASAAESLAALRLSARATTERTDRLEQQAKVAVARLEQSVDARLQAMVAQVTAAADGVTALQAEAGAGPARAELLEQRVRSAMGRLAESVEARLSEVTAERPGQLAGMRGELERAMALQAGELRTEIETAASVSRARATQVEERLEAMEQRLTAMVEATVAEKVRDARTEIATSVADAHRRFVVSVDELDERMTVVTAQAAAAEATVERLEALPDAVVSDGHRIEALEEHTRRTDARLADLVDAKLAELASERLVEMAATRDELRESVDAHLADVRAEVAFTLGEGRAEVAAGTNRVEDALAAVDALGASIESSRQESEARLTHAVQMRLDELEKAAAEVSEGRAEVAAAVAALDRRADEAEAKVRGQVDELAVQVAALVKTASTEGGTLAPLRSDIRMLQERLSELAETVEQLRPRRKAAAPVKKAVRRAAPPAPAAPAKKVAAAKKAPAKKVPAAKKSAARRRPQ